jgi:hypothetical protein
MEANDEEKNQSLIDDLKSRLLTLRGSIENPTPLGPNINYRKNIYLVDLKNIYFSQSTITLHRGQLTKEFLEHYPMKFLKIDDNRLMLINSVGYEKEWTSLDIDKNFDILKLFIPAINTVFINKTQHLVSLDNRRLFVIYIILNSLINQDISTNMGSGTKLSSFFSRNNLLDKQILIPCYIHNENDELPKELADRYIYLDLFRKKNVNEFEEVLSKMTFGNVIIKRFIQQPGSCSDFFLGINTFPYTSDISNRDIKKRDTIPEPYNAITRLYYYSFDGKIDYTKVDRLANLVTDIPKDIFIYKRHEITILKEYKQFIFHCLLYFNVIIEIDPISIDRLIDICIISKSKLIEIHKKTDISGSDFAFNILASPMANPEDSPTAKTDLLEERSAQTPIRTFLPLHTQYPDTLVPRFDLPVKPLDEFPFTKLLQIDKAFENRQINQYLITILERLIHMSNPKSWDKSFNIKQITGSNEFLQLQRLDEQQANIHYINEFLNFLDRIAEPFVMQDKALAQQKKDKSLQKTKLPNGREGGYNNKYSRKVKKTITSKNKNSKKHKSQLHNLKKKSLKLIRKYKYSKNRK